MNMDDSSIDNLAEKPVENILPSNNIVEKPADSPTSNYQRGLHGPSLGIGAGIAIVSIIAVFFAINVMDNSPELQFEEKAPNPENNQPELSLSVFTANASPFLGNENAPITLVEFGDYQCFFCNKFFHDTEGSIIKDYVETGQVKIIFKDFTIIGPDSVSAAQATHCANDQGKFWEFHDELYNNWNGENNGWASVENLKGFASDLGLDSKKFDECLDSKKYENVVAASRRDAQTLGLTGTPAFFVIGPDNQITKIGGAQPFSVFQQTFNSELAK
jgi:protein-disulfide isomerase